MSIAPYVPADLILDSGHVPFFIGWQGPLVKSHHKGMIRNAEEYHQFLQSLKKESGSTNQPIGKNLPGTLGAALCGHELHPSVHLTAHYCPVCEVRMSLTFLEVIGRALQKAGGPWRQADLKDPEMQILRECWHMARLHLQELVENLELLAGSEIQWETENPNQALVAQRMNTATKAARMAIMEHRYPAMISEPKHNEKKRQAVYMNDCLSQQAKKNKKVTFASGTNFEPGRNSDLYCRESNRYEPGDHACEENEGWLNTSQSGLNYPKFCNLKLFLTYSEADFDLLDTIGRIGDYQGLLSHHPNFEAISGYVLENTDHHAGDIGTLANAIGLSDAIVILFDDDNTVLGFCLSSSDDIEDMADEQDVVDQNRWTCLRDIEGVKNMNPHISNVVEKGTAFRKSSVKKMRKIWSM